MSDELIYWSEFRFGTPGLAKFHCTHKFFGQLSDAVAAQVWTTIDDYFRTHLVRPFYVPFKNAEMFGPWKDVRVLTCDPGYVVDLLPDLRAQLDVFKEDDYKPYRPHITTKYKAIASPFTQYKLRGKLHPHGPDLLTETWQFRAYR